MRLRRVMIVSACFLALSQGRLYADTIPADSTPAYTMTGFSMDNANDGTHFSLGYTFTTTSTLTITGLGVLDIGGVSVAAKGPFPVNLYYSASTPSTTGSVDGGFTSGTLVSGGSASVLSSDPIESISGGTYSSGDGFRYHILSTALVLPAGTYEIANSEFGTGFGQNAAGLSTAAGVGAPLHATYNIGNDTGAYNTSTFDANLPGNIGPNFLISTPEPATISLLAIGTLSLLARRRKLR